eukprot:CAMPEP_0177663970 /NCGR_PEP_ID=MMETSP0447-20121125/20218_1 /TAXON_ID=0 /ORGANISM="Stygamoeba regulata, Strain BSH-02190019" /LENGTH=102 /DNA_ID=CAMNT_0019169859 /DNA_START=277 /DNA_END=585 /DNA_ORIENTATION=+
MTGFSNKDHLHGTVTYGAKSIKTAVTAPKRDVVNEQLRGAEVGKKSSIGMDSMSVKKAVDAPRVDVHRAEVKTACAQCGAGGQGGKFCSQCGAQQFTETMHK